MSRRADAEGAVGAVGAVDSPPAAADAATPSTAPSREPPADGEGSLPRVVVLGTSLTAGMGLADPDESAWPARLGELARVEGIELEVVNAGVSGDTSAGGLRRLDWILRDAVDLLVVELGANDGLRGLPVAEMEANLDTIVVRTRRRWPRARVALTAMEAPTNLGRAYTDDFRDAYRRVAERHGALLLPFLLDGVAGEPALNQDDGIHPTPEGHRIMVDNVWAELRPLLEELSR